MRAAIWESGKSSYRISLETGVCQRVIDRFVSRKQDIRLETAAKIAEALGLELRPRNGIQAEPVQTHAGIATESRNSAMHPT
jgi:DNA-binding phage protein